MLSQVLSDLRELCLAFGMAIEADILLEIAQEQDEMAFDGQSRGLELTEKNHFAIRDNSI